MGDRGEQQQKQRSTHHTHNSTPTHHRTYTHTHTLTLFIPLRFSLSLSHAPAWRLSWAQSHASFSGRSLVAQSQPPRMRFVIYPSPYTMLEISLHNARMALMTLCVRFKRSGSIDLYVMLTRCTTRGTRRRARIKARSLRTFMCMHSPIRSATSCQIISVHLGSL